MTTGILDAGIIPIYANTDEEAIKICLKTCADIDLENPRVVRIKNTLCMEDIQVSEALYADICQLEGIEQLSSPVPMRFDESGNLD